MGPVVDWWAVITIQLAHTYFLSRICIWSIFSEYFFAGSPYAFKFRDNRF